MLAPDADRATAAALALVSSLGLPADRAEVLFNSNKLTLRLLPCDVLARVASERDRIAAFEVGLAQALAGGPVARLDPRVEPRVYERDGFEITLWTYYGNLGEPEPAEYARALERLHATMRAVDVPTPHFTDRVGEARRLLADPALTPDLGPADREFLTGALTTLRSAVGGRPEQLLHGEPHPGNVLNTGAGPLFVDLETACRGPVEFDLAHAPDEVADHYPGADRELLRLCRLLMLAMITTWRWDRSDQFPDGRRRAAEWTEELRRGL